jgi:hypothetical protein
MSFRTRGRGIAAASSMMTSSAWPRTWESSGAMYCVSQHGASQTDAANISFAHLDCLPMPPEHIHPHNRLLELWVGALNDIVVAVLLIPQRV